MQGSAKSVTLAPNERRCVMIYKMFEAIAHSTIDTATIITHVAIVVCLIGILLIVPAFFLLCYADDPVVWCIIGFFVLLFVNKFVGKKRPAS